MYARDDTDHYSASTLEECQKACEFDPRCISVDWGGKYGCDLSTESDHKHVNLTSRHHYGLVNRCRITLGQCADNNFVANISIHVYKTTVLFSIKYLIKNM